MPVKNGRNGTDFGPRAEPTLRRAVLIGGTFLVLVSLVATASAATTWDPPPQEWTNGVVLCEFLPSVPTVSVSALERSETGISTTMNSVEEIDPSGDVVASATVPAADWTASNLSNDDAYDLSYSAVVPVTGPSASAPLLGSANLTVAYVLPAYEDSTNESLNSVSVDLQVAGWPWQGTEDHLALSLEVWPSFASEEHLVFRSTPGALLTSVSTSSGAAFEQMDGSASAIANPSSSSPITLPATASVSGNSSSALISVSFGSAAGTFSTLNYSASVTVLFPATVAGIPTIDLVAVGSLAALISVLVAGGVRRVRNRSSDLTFVNEEDQ